MGEFLMPSLGADMDTGTITQWLVHPGDTVHRGDIVAVVDTEKADVEVEIFEDGVVEELLVPEGAEVAVGTPLARIAATRVVEPIPPTPDSVARQPGESGHREEPSPTRCAPPSRKPVSPSPSVGAASATGGRAARLAVSIGRRRGQRLIRRPGKARLAGRSASCRRARCRPDRDHGHGKRRGHHPG